MDLARSLSPYGDKGGKGVKSACGGGRHSSSRGGSGRGQGRKPTIHESARPDVTQSHTRSNGLVRSWYYNTTV